MAHTERNPHAAPGKPHRSTWVTRVLITIVFAINVSCAISFIANPAAFAPAYQVEGPGAQAAIAGMGITFLMWNATYPPVIVHPCKHRTLFVVVICQQAIGLAGESAILAGLDSAAPVLSASILRFIAFDAAGLVALALAFALTQVGRPNR